MVTITCSRYWACAKHRERLFRRFVPVAGLGGGPGSEFDCRRPHFRTLGPPFTAGARHADSSPGSGRGSIPAAAPRTSLRPPHGGGAADPDDKSQPFLVYLKYWTLYLNPQWSTVKYWTGWDLGSLPAGNTAWLSADSGAVRAGPQFRTRLVQFPARLLRGMVSLGGQASCSSLFCPALWLSTRHSKKQPNRESVRHTTFHGTPGCTK